MLMMESRPLRCRPCGTGGIVNRGNIIGQVMMSRGYVAFCKLLLLLTEIATKDTIGSPAGDQRK